MGVFHHPIIMLLYFDNGTITPNIIVMARFVIIYAFISFIPNINLIYYESVFLHMGH